jgi:preprotein translocase subunit SecD
VPASPLGGFKDPFKLQNEARDLAAVLRTGALPAPLRKTFERQVGPSLGKDAIENGTLAFIIGLALVVLFILYYYRGAGLICDIALVINFLFIAAIMAGFNATLTLPGIAGLVLTIGMAVDANVIIYERIREEAALGKTPRAAVEAGYSRAFWTIFDAQLTTFFAAIVLMQYGSGPIRGFAVTLMAGIISSMFTGIVVTRLLFDLVVNKFKPKKLSI